MFEDKRPWQLLRLLKLQKEVQYLTWSITEGKKEGNWIVELSTVGVERKIVGDENACLSELAAVLYDLKEREKWALKRKVKD